jgi:glycosyltransferase involved in cell wall biosynthesis
VRLLYVIDSVDKPGGAEQALAALAPHYVKRGVQLDIAYLIERPGFQEHLESCGAGVFPVTGLSRRATVGALVRLMRERSPDLVHTTLFEADLTGRLAATRARVPVVSSLVNVAYGHEHRGAPGLRPVKVRAAQLADLATARLTRRFHAISEYVADIMGRRLWIRSERIDVVPRGRDRALLGHPSPERRVAVRAALGVAPDVPLLLSAARHEYQKGLDVVIDALGDVRRRVPDAVLLIAGREGNLTPRMREIMTERGVADAVRLLGPRSDVPDLLSAVDVFVAPSRWEGLGSAVLEAMAMHTPIVASDVPAIRETVGSEAYALLVPPGDSAALAAALVATFADAGAAARRAVAAGRRFEERYDIEPVVEGMLGFYARALG